MENVLLVVHILTCIALIGVVLLQRSEGGALGIGGGGGGGLMSGRGAASALTRVTMILAAVFFATSLVLTTLATRSNQTGQSIGDIAAEEDEASDLDLVPGDIGGSQPAPAETPSDLDASEPSAVTEDVPDDLSAAPAEEPSPQ